MRKWGQAKPKYPVRLLNLQDESSRFGNIRFLAYGSPEESRKDKPSMRSNFSALILIVVGVLFLLSNLGMIPHVWPFLRQWWPLALIIAGVVMLVERRGK